MSESMVSVSLYTADHHLIGSVLIPPFVCPPEVLLWGERLFIPYRLSTTSDACYREAFAYCLPAGVPQ